MQTMQQMMQFWQSAATTGVDLTKAWGETVAKAGAPFMASPFGGGDPSSDVTDFIKQLSEGPQLSDMWAIDKQMMEATAAWADMRQRLAHFQMAASEPWKRAMARYQAEAASKPAGEGEDWRKDFGLWAKIANEELIAAQRSEDYLAAQRDLLHSALDVRQRQQQVSEATAKMLGLPTQRDLDDVTRQLTELRREFRTHVRSVEESRAASKRPRPSPRKNASSKNTAPKPS